MLLVRPSSIHLFVTVIPSSFSAESVLSRRRLTQPNNPSPKKTFNIGSPSPVARPRPPRPRPSIPRKHLSSAIRETLASRIISDFAILRAPFEACFGSSLLVFDHLCHRFRFALAAFANIKNPCVYRPFCCGATDPTPGHRPGLPPTACRTQNNNTGATLDFPGIPQQPIAITTSRHQPKAPIHSVVVHRG